MKEYCILYYFDNGSLTTVTIKAKNKSEAILKFWEIRPEANRIDTIHEKG